MGRVTGTPGHKPFAQSYRWVEPMRMAGFAKPIKMSQICPEMTLSRIRGSKYHKNNSSECMVLFFLFGCRFLFGESPFGDRWCCLLAMSLAFFADMQSLQYTPPQDGRGLLPSKSARCSPPIQVDIDQTEAVCRIEFNCL